MKDINPNSKSPDSDTANRNYDTDNVSISHETNNTNEDVNGNKKALKNSKNMNTAASEPKACENRNNETDKVGIVFEERATPSEETPAPSTEAPAPSTEAPAPAAEPDASAAEPDASAAEPDASAAELDAPAVEPDAPAAEPDAPAAEPDAPGAEPVAPAADPDAPAAEPDAPAAEPDAPTVFVPKYKYTDDQWNPLNMSGKKCYDLGLLKQIGDDPISKIKPDVPELETCRLVRETPTFTVISRPINDALFPSFAKGGGGGGGGGLTGNKGPRDFKKDGRNVAPSGKGSVKLTPSQQPHKPVIRVSLSLREDVKLNESENAWKPTRYNKGTVTEEEAKTIELYKQFRGILNKLTPQKFDKLMEKVKQLEINNQRRLEGVIDLIFEKAIEEPNFSEAYANMCHKLYTLKVPADNATSPDQCVNFRALIITKCQRQFETEKVDETVIKLEAEMNACTDPVKRKELQLRLVEENRKARMRSVGNVRFIGELYKLKMLTSKIMVFCMKYLVEKLEEEKLECLCKLLTTIGEQLEGEASEQLHYVFNRMQEIVQRKSNKISSRVRFMLQDVIELRRRKWVTKSVLDSQPKMMGQIQKEAEQHQRHIEMMNAAPMGVSRGREDGGRGRRGEDARRQHNNQFQNRNTPARTTHYSVDTSKLKSISKNVQNIKLAPPSWNHGSGAKISNTPTLSGSLSMTLPATATANKYSILAVEANDPTTLKVSKDSSSGYSKGASIERSTFSSRADCSPAPVPAPAPAAAPPQQPLPEHKKKSVWSSVGQFLDNSDAEELAADVRQLFEPAHHAGLVAEILSFALEKSPKDIARVARGVLHLVSSGTLAADSLLAGLKETLEFAPDLVIDVPMLYDYLAKFVAPHIEKKHITFVQILNVSETIISSKQGHLLLRAIIKDMKDSMGPTFVMTKWQESGLQINQWMSDDQVSKFVQDNGFEFLEGGAKASEEAKKTLSHAETQSKLLQLMSTNEDCDCIRGWVKDNVGPASSEEWFVRALTQAVCEQALSAAGHLERERIRKYAGLIGEFGDSKPAREAACLLAVQQLIHRLEHPQGLTLEIFQYLHEQYLISVEGFIAWETSEHDLEGKGVMMKALTSFFTNIKEADNEDSCSED